MSLIFPEESAVWRRHIQQILIQHHVDIQRLWKRMSETPQPEPGCCSPIGLPGLGISSMPEGSFPGSIEGSHLSSGTNLSESSTESGDSAESSGTATFSTGGTGTGGTGTGGTGTGGTGTGGTGTGGTGTGGTGTGGTGTGGTGTGGTDTGGTDTGGAGTGGTGTGGTGTGRTGTGGTGTGGTGTGGTATGGTGTGGTATGGTNTGGTVPGTGGTGITGCCPGVSLPATLTATFANSLGCPCLSGATTTLTWNGSEWTGSLTPGSCGHVYKMVFACIDPESNLFETRVHFPDNCRADLSASSSAFCNPFYTSVFLGAAGTNCGCSGSAHGASFVIDISE